MPLIGVHRSPFPYPPYALQVHAVDQLREFLASPDAVDDSASLAASASETLHSMKPSDDLTVAAAGVKRPRHAPSPERLRLAVLESPTGTGKSHMLLSATLSHLFDVSEPVAEKTLAAQRPENSEGIPEMTAVPPVSLAEAVAAAKRQAEQLSSSDGQHWETKIDDTSDPRRAIRRALREQRRQQKRLDRHFRLLDAAAQSMTGSKVDSSLLVDQDPAELLRELEASKSHSSGVSQYCSVLDSEESDSSHSSRSEADHRQSPTDEDKEDEVLDEQWVSVARDIPLRRPKLYLASRTHTQLEQMRSDIQQTVFAEGHVKPRCAIQGSNAGHPLTVVHMASRFQLCINSTVKRGCGAAGRGRTTNVTEQGREHPPPPPSDMNFFNEACMEAIKYEASPEGRRARRRSQAASHSTFSGMMKASTSVEIPDVEDLLTSTSSGEGFGCPYAIPSRLRAFYRYVLDQKHSEHSLSHQSCSSKKKSVSLSLEEAIRIGKALGACPYLASRLLLRAADVVLLPYTYVVEEDQRQHLLGGVSTQAINDEEEESLEASLLHRRSSVPILSRQYMTSMKSKPVEHQKASVSLSRYSRLPPDCRGDVLVLDEAHNLADQCLQISTSQMSLDGLVLVHALLHYYLARYQSRLLSLNKQRLRELSRWVHSISLFLQKRHTARDEAAEGTVVEFSFTDLLFDAGVDHVDLHPLCQFLQTSRLLLKLRGVLSSFIEQRNAVVSTASVPSSTTRMQNTESLDLALKTGERFSFMTFDNRAPGTVEAAGERLLQVLRGLTFRESGGEGVDTSLDLSHCLRVTSAALQQFHSFLRWFERSSASTKVLLVPMEAPSWVSMQLLQLDPGTHTLFPLLRQVHCTVFAGGTLQPLRLTLYPLLPASHRHCTPAPQPGGSAVRYGRGGWQLITEPHVVPSSSFRVWALGVGPSGLPWNFSQKSIGTAPRSTRDGETGSFPLEYSSEERRVLRDVAVALMNFARVLPPEGVICFVPSYHFQYRLLRFLRDEAPQNSAETFEQHLNAAKRVFAEVVLEEDEDPTVPSTTAQPFARRPAEGLMDSYRRWIEGENACSPTRGALLFSVMGGKLSEGLNFADHLGRAVVVIGMPYANPTEPVTRNFLTHIVQQSTATPGAPAGSAALFALYTDMCMRLVNQSVGRCIRHRGDYAVALLLDNRYTSGRSSKRILEEGLSSWMQPSISTAHSFAECFRGVREFFHSRRTKPL